MPMICFSGSVILSHKREISVLIEDFRPRHFLKGTINPSLLPRRIGLMLRTLPRKAAGVRYTPGLRQIFQITDGEYAVHPGRVGFQLGSNVSGTHTLVTHLTGVGLRGFPVPARHSANQSGKSYDRYCNAPSLPPQQFWQNYRFR